MSGASMIKIFFQPGANPSSAMNDIVNLIASDMFHLPPGIEYPFTLRSEPANLPVVLAAITGEVGLVPGVESVDVSIDTKTVTVVGGDTIAVVAAIDEAGYEIAAPQRSAATAEQQLDDGDIISFGSTHLRFEAS